jgi:hypothetical protein
VTPKGLRLLRRLDQPVMDVHARQFPGWTDRELSRLAADLERIAAQT